MKRNNSKILDAPGPLACCRWSVQARLLGSAGFGLLMVVASGARAQIPITGTQIPSLQPIDQLVTNFMSTYQIPGAAVAFMKNARLVYARGFGYANTNTLELVQPDSVFRIASMSKSLTAAAILRLVDQGKLSLDQSAFAILNYAAPVYAGATNDPRLASITVRQLLNHTGGWDRNSAIDPNGNIGFDPTVNWTVRAAADMGTTAPADATTMVRWMLGKPLQFNPGTQYQYSNFGYTVLGRIIEKIADTNYEGFVKGMLAEAGISRMRIGGSREVELLPGEVHYYDYPGGSLTTSIFPQDSGPVPWPYNFSYSTMDSHGGWVASAIDILRFISVVDNRAAPPDILSQSSISNMIARPTPPWGATQEPYYGMGWQVRNTPDNWWHDGALPGTRTEMVRAGNGFTWVILCNTRAYNDSAMFSAMDNLGWQAQTLVASWPTNDYFDSFLSYAAWKARKFNSAQLADPAVSGDLADPDTDGLSNLMEYSMGLTPLQADTSRRPLPAIQTVSGTPYLTLTFRRLYLANEVDYGVEVSSNLFNWGAGAQMLSGPVLNADGTETFTYQDNIASSNSAMRFMRLKVTER
jgi:CubicO group peptidase (beta-lactamase class C family)